MEAIEEALQNVNDVIYFILMNNIPQKYVLEGYIPKEEPSMFFFTFGCFTDWARFKVGHMI